jgi:4'-phosphopantetheinyl transferase EntD
VTTLATAHGTVVLLELTDDELAAAHAALHPAAQAHAATLSPGRRRDFIAGRHALRAALAVLGALGSADDAALLGDDRGAPRMPAGAVGSISHKRTRAAALAAADDGATRGVDLERLVAGTVDISRRILTAREQAGIAALSGAARAHALAVRFALKEAIYKAVDPFVRRYVGFTEVELDLADEVAAVTIVDLARLPVEVEARWQELDGHVVATARARRVVPATR